MFQIVVYIKRVASERGKIMTTVSIDGQAGRVDLDECVDGIYTVYMDDHSICYAELSEMEQVVSEAQPGADITLNGQVFLVSSVGQSDSQVAKKLANKVNEKGFSKKVKSFLNEFGIKAPRWNKQESLTAIKDFANQTRYGI